MQVTIVKAFPPDPAADVQANPKLRDYVARLPSNPTIDGFGIDSEMAAKLTPAAIGALITELANTVNNAKATVLGYVNSDGRFFTYRCPAAEAYFLHSQEGKIADLEESRLEFPVLVQKAVHLFDQIMGGNTPA